MSEYGLKAFHTVLKVVFVLYLLIYATPAFSATQDWDFPGGHFFTQAGGYSITDNAGISFWGEFQRLGGVDALGYPSSRRFVWDGFVAQATQRVVLQWRPEIGKAAFVNVFDQLHELGKDDWLLATRQVPRIADWSSDTGKPWSEVVAAHLALLDANPSIKAKYYAVVGDPIQMNGLPMAPIADMGNVFVLRAQRVVIQQWKVDVPWARAGDVTVALGGDIAKEAGLVPSNAATPERPAQPVPPAAGAVGISPASTSVAAGSATEYFLSIPIPGGAAPTPPTSWLVVSDLPTGTTASFLKRADPWNVTLVIRTSCTTPKGAYQVVVEGFGPDLNFAGNLELKVLDPLVESSPGMYSTSLAQGSVAVLNGGPTTEQDGLFLNLQFCGSPQPRKLSITVQSVKSGAGANLPVRTPVLLESWVGPASTGQTFQLNTAIPPNAVLVDPVSSNGTDHIEWPLRGGQYILFLGQSPLDNRERPAFATYQVAVTGE